MKPTVENDSTGRKRKWYLANRERVLAKMRVDYAANRDVINAAAKARHEANPGIRREYDRRRYHADPVRRAKNKENARAWNVANPERVHARGLKKAHGIGLEEYSLLLQLQNGCCAICHCPPVGDTRRTQKLHVDHDHKHDLIRELLCTKCNMAIGLLRENPDICISAAEYLKKWAQAIQKTRAV